MAYRAAVCDDSAADADYVRGIVAHWAEQQGRRAGMPGPFLGGTVSILLRRG